MTTTENTKRTCTTDADNPCGTCPPCRRSQLRLVPSSQSAFGPVRKWGMLPQSPAAPQDAETWPDCDFDPGCPVHGILGGKV